MKALKNVTAVISRKTGKKNAKTATEARHIVLFQRLTSGMPGSTEKPLANVARRGIAEMLNAKQEFQASLQKSNQME